MIKVSAMNGNTFDFDADTWMPSGEGIVLYKGSEPVAQFSAYQFVERVPDPAPPEPPAPVEAQDEA